MNIVTKKALYFLILVLFVSLIILFCILFIYFNRHISKNDIFIKSLKNLIILRYSFIYLLKLLPPTIIFISITSFSIIFTLSPFQKASFSFNDIAIPPYITLLVLLIFIVVSEFFLIPKFYKDISVYKYKFSIAENALKMANEETKKKRYQKTIDFMEIYLDIDKNNKKANKLYNDAIKNLTGANISFKTAEIPEKDKPIQTPFNFFEEGKLEYEKGNYYKALFYLEKAYLLHKDNKEITEFYERCKKKVAGLLGSITANEEKTKRLIQQKERAISYLNDKDYYKAYKIFSELNKRYPDLSDIALYLKAAEENILKEDFLSSVLKDIEWMPSFKNIVFIDKMGFMNTIEKIIIFNNNFYFYNIKRFKSGSNSLYFSAKYGKWIKDSIRLKNNEGFEYISEDKRMLYYIYPYVNPNYLIYTVDKDNLLNQLTVYERINLSNNLRQSGIDIENKYFYFSKKLGIFFSCYVLSIFFAALAWSRRSIYDFPPKIKLFLFILIVPFLSYFLYLLYIDVNSIIIYSHRYFIRYLLKNINIALYTGIINIVLAAISTIYFLSRISKLD